MRFAIKKWADVLQIISGRNQKEVLDPTGSYPIYGSGGIMGYANQYLCEAGTTIVGRKGTIDNPIFVNERFWNVDTAFGVSPGEQLNPRYLYFFCRHFNFKQLDKSTTIPSLAKRDLLSIEMPVPPLVEQKRIVEKIEELFSELDNGVETLKKTKQQLAVYRQSVLKAAFEACDEKVAVESVCQYVTDGDHMPPPKAQSGVPFIMISNIENGVINWNNTAFVARDYYNGIDNKRRPSKGDVLYTVTGSYGIPVLIDFEKQFCFQRHIALLRPKNRINQKFLYYAMQEPGVYAQATKGATGTAQKTVGLAVLRAIKIPYCDGVNVQMKIVKDIERRMSVCDSIEKTVDAALQQAESMRQSILKKAFEGKL